jgi:hypothetical protein
MQLLPCDFAAPRTISRLLAAAAMRTVQTESNLR